MCNSFQLLPFTDHTQQKETQREDVEKGICTRLGHFVNVFHELGQSAIPVGPCVDNLIKTVTRLYKSLTLLVKYVSVSNHHRVPVHHFLHYLLGFVIGTTINNLMEADLGIILWDRNISKIGGTCNFCCNYSTIHRNLVILEQEYRVGQQDLVVIKNAGKTINCKCKSQNNCFI